MAKRLSVVILLTTAATFWSNAGCDQNSQEVSVAPEAAVAAVAAGEEEYNPHDVPITDEQKAEMKEATATFQDAVAKIKELRYETEQETKDGIPTNPYVTHQALDRADLVLQWLPQVARDSGVAKEHWEEINTTTNELRTLFEKIHESIDNKQDPNFASVAADMDERLSRLEEIAQNDETAD